MTPSPESPRLATIAYAAIMAIAAVTPSFSQPANPDRPNALTSQEVAAGWQLLWDGKTTAGWRTVKADDFPAHGWTLKEGVLTVYGKAGAVPAGEDIITRGRYANFELTADFRTTPACNSGIKIFVQDGTNVGMEFQILDDERHPDAKLGRNGDRTCGSLYDLIPAPSNKVVMPMGEWNHARIVSRGRHVEFWLNGSKTVECDRGSPDFRAAVAASKFKNIHGFGDWADGHILLQGHDSEVSFRNVKLRVLAE